MDDRHDDENEEGAGAPAGVLLMRSWNDGEAALISHLLAAYGIPCQVVSDIPHAVFPVSVDGLGEIRILVPESRLEDARAVLADHRRHGFEVIPGGGEDEDGSDDDLPEEDEALR